MKDEELLQYALTISKELTVEKFHSFAWSHLQIMDFFLTKTFEAGVMMTSVERDTICQIARIIWYFNNPRHC